jgi:hypothetical protein
MNMADFGFVALTIVFFLAAWAFAEGCQRL